MFFVSDNNNENQKSAQSAKPPIPPPKPPDPQSVMESFGLGESILAYKKNETNNND